MTDAKSIKPVVFKDEMQRVTRTLSRDDELRVVIAGTRAYTNGDVVVLPDVDNTQNLSVRETNVARGYVDHESAHKRYTDIAGGWLKSAKEKYGDLGESIMQGIEDVRIEAKNIEAYPGSKINLSATSDATYKVLQKGIEEGEYDLSDPNRVMPILTTIYGREELGYDMSSEATQVIKDTVDQETRDKAKDLAKKSIQAGSTEDAYNLMVQYCDEIDPPEQQENQSSDGSEKGNGKGNGEGNGNSGSNGQGGSGAGGAEAGGADASNLDELRNKAVEEALGKDRKNYGQVPYLSDWEADGWISKKNSGDWINCSGRGRYGPLITKDHDPYNAVKRDIGPSLNAIKQTFERYLMSQMNRSWEGGLAQGMLDPRRLAQVPAGSENVYRRRDPVNELDTAVSLIVDMSGSMHGSPIELAQQACIALAEAMHRLGIPFEIVGHTTSRSLIHCDPDLDGGGAMSIAEYEALPFGKGRKRIGEFDLKEVAPSEGVDLASVSRTRQWIPVLEFRPDWYKTLLATRFTVQDIIEFKTFDDRLFDCEPQLGIMHRLTGGGTIEGDTVLKVYQRALRRKEKKRVIVVLSDGMPGGTGMADEEDWTREVCRYVEGDKNCHLMQIGINSAAGRAYYSNVHVIRSLRELAPTLFANLKHLLSTKKAS